MTIQRVFVTLAASLVVYGLFRLFRIVYEELTSPLRFLPGPKSSSWLYGNIKDIWKAENAVLHEKWVDEYGPTVKYRALFQLTRLYTVDLKALNHVLMNTHIYQKPAPARYNLGRVVGSGVLVVEGDKHKQQRRVMNPAFGPVQIRELTGVFMQKATQLRDILSGECSKQGGTGRIDVLSWLSRTTLDVIGLAGFNYQFDSLNDNLTPNELNQAFATMFRATMRIDILPFLQGMFPPLRMIKTERDAKIKKAQKVMNRIGTQLLASSKAAVVNSEKEGIVDQDTLRSRNLLSLLVKANTDKALPDHQKMSDEDVLAQVPTFLVAGHETTSTATTWALYALTQKPEVQTKLRNELLAVPTDTPTMDELNTLPYLDAVVRETLRIHAPVASTIRVAVCDDVLPLSQPVTDLRGVTHNAIRIKKGQTILIPILAINRSKALWGDDSLEFKPERWQTPSEAVSAVPGVWGNLMTFLGGPRSCIGYRFSLVEMKALLFALVRGFEFELAVPAKDIGKRSTIVQRPILLSDPDAGNVMPLLIKPYTP